MPLISLAVLAFLLGFKHSYDADHLIAVSSLLRKVRSVREAIRFGTSWALGHMITAGLITVLLFFFKDSVFSLFLSHFEFLVGIMLIVLGCMSVRDAIFHDQMHEHNSWFHRHLVFSDVGTVGHTHRFMFAIGIVHGLASNDELLMFLSVTFGVATLWSALMGVGIFSIGVVMGMASFSAICALPYLRAQSREFYRFLCFMSGAVGICYGAVMLL